MKGQKRLILEFSEFNFQRMNSDSNPMSVHVDNPQLSQGAFDKHQDLIRQANSRLNSIMGNLSANGSFGSIGKFEDEQEITSLTIQRIFSSDSVNYDIYIEFKIDDEEDIYYGVIKNFNTSNPTVKSEAFRDHSLLQSREWIIKTKGIIVKAIKKWLSVDRGKYVALKGIDGAIDMNTGVSHFLENGTEIVVVGSFDNKVIFKVGNDQYQMMNDNFYYFNYWFAKID